MAQWLNKMKSLAGDAADSTSRAAQRAKLDAEIKYAEREIRLCKERFGVAVWDIFNSDKAKVEAEYARHEKEVQVFLADIQVKQEAIEQLKASASAADAPLGPAAPVVETPAPISATVAAPPAPPPGALRSSGPWTEFSDPKGKLYYHNSKSNATQWQAPPELTGAGAVGYPVAADVPTSHTDTATRDGSGTSGLGSSSGSMLTSVLAAASTMAIAGTLASKARQSDSMGGLAGPAANIAASPPVAGSAAVGTDPGALASMFTAVAGVAAATGTTNDVAKAAAPHVAAAAQQRYTGDDGMQKLTSDASTIASVGAAVASNPAAKALGSALLAGALSSATAPAAKK